MAAIPGMVIFIALLVVAGFGLQLSKFLLRSSAWFYYIRASFCCVSCSIAVENVCSCLFTTVRGFPIFGLTDAIN